jgi:hypothetical protein
MFQPTGWWKTVIADDEIKSLAVDFHNTTLFFTNVDGGPNEA